MSEWISITNQSPKEGQNFLSYDDQGEIHCAYWCSDTDAWYVGGWERCLYCGGRSRISLKKMGNYLDESSRFVKFWKEIPEPPEPPK